MGKAKRFIGVSLTWVLVGSLVMSLVLPAAPVSAQEEMKRTEVRKTMTPPVIDGDVGEAFWSLSETLDVPLGEGLSSAAEMGFLWDNQYLYIGMKMKDDQLMSEAPGYWFQQDSVSLFFDPTLHRSAPYVNSDMQAGFVYKPNSATPDFYFGAALDHHSGKDAQQILRAIRTTGEGWSLEVAVPWSMLDMNPIQQQQLGFEATATDRYGNDASNGRVNAWSAHQSSSFWNDTSGFGILALVKDNPVSGDANPVLLEENFDSFGSGEIPYGWISDVQAGSPSFSVTEDTYGNKSMTFAGTASGKQARITAPVQWDNYSIEADVRFHSVLNAARWAALMFRAAPNGQAPYHQMAVRQNGSFEVAYRNPSNSWSVMASGSSDALELGKDYTLKVRVFGDNVKEYIKVKDEGDYKLLLDQEFTSGLLGRGKIGFQGDQSTVSFDNLKVTRIKVDDLRLAFPPTVESLTGPYTVTGSVYFSDGVEEAIVPERIQYVSSDESVLKVSGGMLYPLKAGSAVLTAVYANAEWSQEVTVEPGADGVSVTSLSHDSGYVLAEAGKEMALAELPFTAQFNDFTYGTMTGADLTWSADDSSIVVNDGKLIVQDKGVYSLTGEKDGASVSLLVVAKDEASTEYVLYENDFEQEADGDFPDGWTKVEGKTDGKAAVKDGAFVIDASSAPDNPTRVLLPEYLELFGNYDIEADVTHAAANEPTRWHSIMYRTQNRTSGSYPYYHMAVRQNAKATNGVEFAERTANNTWNVMNKGAFGETIHSDTMYRYKVAVHGVRVMQSINGQVIVNTDQAGSYLRGGIGLQANGSVMKVDHLKVTLRETELPPLPESSFVETAKADTFIALAPSVIAELQNKAQLDSYAEGSLPATLVIYVNSNLQVTDPEGKQEFMSLQDALQSIGTRIMPAFYVEDSETVGRLIAHLTSIGLEDAFIVSNQPELVKEARQAYPMLRGIVDFSGWNVKSNEDLMAIRKQTTLSGAKIAMLSRDAATKDNTAYLQQRTIVVWSKEVKLQNEQDKYMDIHRMITAGVNGMITSSPSEAYRALGVYFYHTTLIRKPYMIGHRGMPSVAPENTIISNELAIEAGADYIENDIFLSKDGHLVIIHDSAVHVTTHGTGRVEDMTLEELRSLKVRQVPGAEYPEARIATLEEQIDLARERGVMIYAEIKTHNPAAVDAFVKLVKEKDAEDLFNVMSFDTNQLDRLAAQLPDMPLGLLTGGYASENRVNGAMRETLKVMQRYNSTLNTSYGGLGPKFMDAAHQRGLIISPWTFNNYDHFINTFLLGVFGITTDYAYWAKDWVISIEPENQEVIMKSGESSELSAWAESYSHERKQVNPSIVLLDDSGIVSLDQDNGSKIKAGKPGTTYVLLRYTGTIDEEKTYDIYTEPVKVKIVGGDHGDGSGIGSGGDGSDDGDGSGGGDGSSNENGGSGDDHGSTGPIVDQDNNGNPGNDDSSSDPGSNDGPDSPVSENPSTGQGRAYADINDHWAFKAIMHLSANGIMEGYDNGSFKPDQEMTRAEFVTVVSRILGLSGAPAGSVYTDVAESAWYSEHVKGMVHAGIIQGYADGTFRPDRQMSREEVWVILYRAFQNKLTQQDLTQQELNASSYSDLNEISAWAQKAISALTMIGIVNGYPDGTLKPKGTITRAEAAALLVKLVDK
ncbi:S-layer homology domain-containing protein [Paenibacillus sp. JSM ZJ436]|uniref:S-layer homology domain-containing protein n=1 Tax=Paenibacillus sp. JSM ZJ436 TaxID=3376190 RepID=UPI0037A46E44